jgi:DNA-binding response OmpR family regulator
MLTTFLRSCDYRVLVATHGKQADRICDKLESKIDLVLTTFTLADTDGLRLACGLRMQHPNLKIMGMSSYPWIGKEFERIGLQFIEKPFDKDELIARIRKYLAEPSR